jgi:hypothetical protein
MPSLPRIPELPGASLAGQRKQLRQPTTFLVPDPATSGRKSLAFSPAGRLEYQASVLGIAARGDLS